MVSCSCAGDVEQVALGVIDLLQIRVVTHGLDPLLQGNDLIVTGHHHHRSKFQSFGQMHGADRDVAAGGLNVLIENFERQSGF